MITSTAANLNPADGAQVDSGNPDRGLMLIVSGERDNIVPRTISRPLRGSSAGVTEFRELRGRDHSLTITSGWAQMAQTALDFIKRPT